MVEDLNIINNFSILKMRTIVVCGSKDYVRKACKMLVRAGVFIEKIYCDDSITDDELMNLEKNAFADVFCLTNKEKYNIIYAEKDQNVLDKNLEQLDCDNSAHIYTYCGLYIAFAINVKNDKSKEMICMNQLNHAIGMYDLAARWLRGIRWVEESGINVLLYAMPKTGTQSMKATLNKYGIEHTYIHFLNLFHPLDRQFYDYYGEKIPYLAEMLHNSEYVNDYYLNFIKNKKLKIITSVREPIARNFSMIFQSIKNWGPYPLVYRSNGNFKQGIINYLDYCNASTWEWFDYEIKEIFGIDVFQYPFDREKGYAIIKEGNVEIFLYKLEGSKHINKALGDFFGEKKGINMLVHHETNKEEYRFIYEQMKEELHISDQLLSKNYDNSKMEHFYTKDEITAFQRKWN